jgi:hypothetical protein
MLAQAAQQVMQQNQAQAAQAQAQQQMQDPVVQMQMQELQIKKQDSDTKKQKVLVDAAIASDAQKLREQEVSGRLQLEGLKLSTKLKADQERQTFEQEHAGLKLGAQMDKDKKAQALTALQSISQLNKQTP